MECKTARLLLPFLRTPGELPPEDVQAIETHLAGCPECRAAVKSEAEFDRAVAQAMVDVAVPAGLQDAIRTRLAQENARVWRRRLVRVSAVAAGLLLVVSIALGWWQSRIVFSPEQFAAEQDQQFIIELDRRLESAEDYFRGQNLRTELPRDFDYGLLQSLEVVNVKGKSVAKLQFVNGEAHAKVFVLPKRDFRLKQDVPPDVIGSHCTVEVINTSPDFLFVIIYTGKDSNRQKFLPQAVIG